MILGSNLSLIDTRLLRYCADHRLDLFRSEVIDSDRLVATSDGACPAALAPDLVDLRNEDAPFSVLDDLDGLVLADLLASPTASASVLVYERHDPRELRLTLLHEVD